ncbi:MAG: ribosomal RNA small subunit methyltransferase E [Chitinophagales bacterium]|nr:MAG: ribosomal RNA small subunit methyltransferase E [Chitinophagales bacterium]
MQLFYHPLPENEAFLLNVEESHHCLKVLRKRVGDEIFVVDGKGTKITARITGIIGHQCRLEMVGKETGYGKKDYRLEVGIALPKNVHRLEWFVEKATELGADAIYPLRTERTERQRCNTERLHKIMIAAMKQSGRAYLPQLHAVTPFDRITEYVQPDMHNLIAVCGNYPHLKTIYRPLGSVLILIGPEGDFSEAEREKAVAGGFEPVSLGSARLRLETAALAVCSFVHLVNG